MIDAAIFHKDPNQKVHQTGPLILRRVVAFFFQCMDIIVYDNIYIPASKKLDTLGLGPADQSSEINERY